MKNMNLRISGGAALVMILGFIVAAILCLSAKSPTTTPATADSASAAVAVTTETSGITIVRDRGAQLNFVPAKAGTNVGK